MFLSIKVRGTREARFDIVRPLSVLLSLLLGLLGVEECGMRWSHVPALRRCSETGLWHQHGIETTAKVCHEASGML